jgi:hypothetical protein
MEQNGLWSGNDDMVYRLTWPAYLTPVNKFYRTDRFAGWQDSHDYGLSRQYLGPGPGRTWTHPQSRYARCSPFLAIYFQAKKSIGLREAGRKTERCCRASSRVETRMNWVSLVLLGLHKMLYVVASIHNATGRRMHCIFHCKMQVFLTIYVYIGQRMNLD